MFRLRLSKKLPSTELRTKKNKSLFATEPVFRVPAQILICAASHKLENVMGIFKYLYPDEWVDSTYDINFEEYYEKGFRGIIFDIDNTLVPHGADADERAKALITRLKKIGYKICLVSNNKKARVERFNKDIDVNYIFLAQKPYHKNYYIAAMKMRLSIGSVLCVGDQIFTDICGGNKSDLHTILVKPIDKHEEIQIVLKRKLEAIVLFFYKRKLKEKSIRKRILRRKALI